MQITEVKGTERTRRGFKMDAKTITQDIEKYTAENSNYETSRCYISLSHCALGVDEILSQWENGFKDSLETRLRCYKGYQMEFDMVMRLSKIYPGKIKTAPEITAFGGLVKGHPDFQFYGRPGDCKSVLMDEWIPQNGKLPRRVYWQMQGYMLYSENTQSLVIYESREGGRVKAFWVYPNRKVQSEINEKLKMVVKEIREK